MTMVYVISGGSDTIAAITGGIAEAFPMGQSGKYEKNT